MRKTILVLLTIVLVPFCAFGVDGVVLINQSTVLAAGGFPYRITQEGSYRLSGNLTVPDANTAAIQVAVDNVTIDLNGFSIIGPVVCGGVPVSSCSPTATGLGANGVDATNSRHVTVVNGTVRGMGNNGIRISQYGYIEKVQVFSNGSGGIVAGLSTVRGNTAAGNLRDGIVCIACTVSENMVSQNGRAGINASGTVSGNMVGVNGSDGIAMQGTASANSSFDNVGRGIFASCPSSVVGNMTDFNGGANLATSGSGCVVANNAAP